MKSFKSANEVLDFAIAREKEAAKFYTDLAKKMKRPEMKQVFLEFALEEKGHQAKLEFVKSGKLLLGPAGKKVGDLQIGDYLVETKPSPDMTYRDALILAMQKEKAAFRLYQDLARVVSDPGLQNILLGLAQEEAKHKLRFEIEYDDNFLPEN